MESNRPIALALLFLGLLSHHADARPQFGFPQIANTPSNTLAGLGVGAAGLFAVKNIAEGNNRLSVSPYVNLNYNPQTQEFAPAINAAVKVGDGPGPRPQFNLGAQYDSQGFAPVVGGGVAFGDDNGGVNPALNTGYVIRDGQAQGVIGGGVNVGSFDLGSLPFGRRRRR